MSMSSSSDPMSDVLRSLVVQITVHDEPAPGAWMCGECPYMNVGTICTKCSAPRWKGAESPWCR